jgi:hypothetical protein
VSVLKVAQWRALIAVVFLVQTPALGADVVSLLNGDRVTGRIVGSTTRRIRLQTPYGVLVLPRDTVVRIERDDGSVEVVNAPKEPPTPPPPPPQEPARLQLTVAGDTFWHAWDPKAAPADPSLRLALRLDNAPLASYTDSTLDPEDLPRAVVNSFVFSPELLMRPSPGVVTESPIVAGGEIGLALSIPPEAAGTHTLALAYELNEGTTAEPAWRDLVTASAEVVVNPGQTLRLRLTQNRGTTAYERRRMVRLSTFSVRLEGEPEPVERATAP